jgi:hypothetical protein
MKKVLMVVSLSASLLGAPSAEAAVERVKAPELMNACQYDVAERDDAGRVLGCAQQCWSAADIVSAKAADARQHGWMALLIGLVVTAIGGALAFIAIARAAGKAGWSSGQSLGTTAGAALLIFLVGWGVSVGLRMGLAGGDEEDLFLDGCALKQAGVTGPSWTNGNRMTCTDAQVREKVLSEGRNQLDLYEAVAAFRGIERKLPVVNTQNEPDRAVVSVRFDQFARFLAAAEKLDPGSQCGAESEPTTSSGPISVVRNATAFPWNPPIASLIALVGAYALAFVLRRVRR